MAIPRSKYVQEGQEGTYHCHTRCVRRSYLCGLDQVTGRDYSHRKQWIVDRLKLLSTVFAIDVCAFAVLWNHFHTILRTRPDLAELWSDRDVASRWLTLFPKRPNKKAPPARPTDEQISALMASPDRIAQLRKRLSNLSWFMGRLNEFIARAANKEDKVKGRFWESRFKCQALLDEPAIAACMTYVDLNPIRARLAATPEDSDFTSIQERIRIWLNENLTPSPAQNPSSKISEIPGAAGPIPNPTPNNSSDSWLCPIQSNPLRRGILQMSASDYFDLVDRSGRILRSDKRGSIDPGLTPILLRIGANSDSWLNTISRFETNFYLAAGLLSNLRIFADKLGRRWLKGVSSARAAFASSPPRSA
jgi:hypothetical protein